MNGISKKIKGLNILDKKDNEIFNIKSLEKQLFNGLKSKDIKQLEQIFKENVLEVELSSRLNKENDKINIKNEANINFFTGEKDNNFLLSNLVIKKMIYGNIGQFEPLNGLFYKTHILEGINRLEKENGNLKQEFLVGNMSENESNISIKLNSNKINLYKKVNDLKINSKGDLLKRFAEGKINEVEFELYERNIINKHNGELSYLIGNDTLLIKENLKKFQSNINYYILSNNIIKNNIIDTQVIWSNSSYCPVEFNNFSEIGSNQVFKFGVNEINSKTQKILEERGYKNIEYKYTGKFDIEHEINNGDGRFKKVDLTEDYHKNFYNLENDQTKIFLDQKNNRLKLYIDGKSSYPIYYEKKYKDSDAIDICEGYSKERINKEDIKEKVIFNINKLGLEEYNLENFDTFNKNKFGDRLNSYIIDIDLNENCVLKIEDTIYIFGEMTKYSYIFKLD